LANISTDYEDKAQFLANVSPLIKNGMFSIFLHLNFPSTLEVTSSRDRRLLASFGLTEKAPLANFVFNIIFSSSHGNTTTPLKVNDDSFSCPSSSTTVAVNLHPFDTPFMHEQLWFNLGVGSFAVMAKKKTAAPTTATDPEKTMSMTKKKTAVPTT
jgi:hypothetical protein